MVYKTNNILHCVFTNIKYYTVSQKKTGPFPLEHNFNKYCPILIILSLLQTEINCDQA